MSTSKVMPTFKLLLLAGDGIGPEVMAEVKRLLLTLMMVFVLGGCTHGQVIDPSTYNAADWERQLKNPSLDEAGKAPPAAAWLLRAPLQLLRFLDRRAPAGARARVRRGSARRARVD